MGVSVPARTWLGLTVSDASDRWYEMVHVPLRPAIKVPFTGHFGGNTEFSHTSRSRIGALLRCTAFGLFRIYAQ